MNVARAIARTFAYPGLAVGGFVHGIKAGLAGQWEGGESTRFRQRAPRALESQDRGLNYGRREDMISEARALSQTFSILRKIVRQYANHVVSSCRMKWSTGVPAIDKAYADGWQNWMMMADKGGRHHYRQLTKMAVKGVVRDGGSVGQFDDRLNFLQVGIVEYDRISSGGIYNLDTPNLVGGFGIDGNGRETMARVWERTLYGYFINPQEIPRNQYVHVFDSDRYDACKGVTAFHSILEPSRDYKETANAERLASKRNSKLALLVKTVAGGAQGRAVSLFGGDDSASDDGSGVNSQVNTQMINDVADAYMFPNEEMKSHTSERPSEGWRWLMEQNIREIAAGLDLPFGVVWHMAGLGGPAARFEISQANRVFMAFLNDIIDPMWHRPIVGRWLAIEISNKRLPFHPLWFKFATPRPKSITIDLGRDSKAGIAENAAGLGTATDWYAEEDQEFEDKTDQLAYEAYYRRSAILKPEYAAVGVTIEDVRQPQMPVSKPDAAEPDQDDPPDPKEKKPLKKGANDDSK